MRMQEMESLTKDTELLNPSQDDVTNVFHTVYWASKDVSYITADQTQTWCLKQHFFTGA